MSINWKAYYEKESEISDFNPNVDPSEIQRCLAAWSVFPGEGFSLLDVELRRWFSGGFPRAKAQTALRVDISAARLERAGARYPGIAYVQGPPLAAIQ
jgi:hypothetical protein